jgi:hypothetical protein
MHINIYLDCLLGNTLVSCVCRCSTIIKIFLTRLLLFLNTRLQRQWKQAISMAELLLRENNWSKATSCYLLATFKFEDNQSIATDDIIHLYK